MKFDRTGLQRRSELTIFPLTILISLPLSLGVIAVARWAPGYLLDWAHCPLREVTGLPCPTCGATLATTRLAAGFWSEAINSNPLVALFVVGYALVVTGTIGAIINPRWSIRLVMSAGQKKAAKWVAAILIIANWAWLIVRYASVT